MSWKKSWNDTHPQITELSGRDSVPLCPRHTERQVCSVLEGGNREVKRVVYHGGKAEGKGFQSWACQGSGKKASFLKSLLQVRKKSRWLRAGSMSLLTELLALAVLEYNLQYSATKDFDWYTQTLHVKTAHRFHVSWSFPGIYLSDEGCNLCLVGQVFQLL